MDPPPLIFPTLFLLILVLIASTPTQAILQDDFGDITCIPGEYDADENWERENDPEGKFADSGWGNCHDPAIGLAGAKKVRSLEEDEKTRDGSREMAAAITATSTTELTHSIRLARLVCSCRSAQKFCFRTQVNTTFVDWRCSCSTTWPLVGDDCETLRDDYIFIQITFVIPLLLNAFFFKFGLRTVRTMHKFSDTKKKWNAANISCLFNVGLMFSETCRFLTWIFRAAGFYDDETFFPLQIFNR